IVSIVAAIAVPRYGQAMGRYHIKLAAARVAADLTLARRQAKLTSTAQRFVVNADSYSMPNVAHVDRSSGTYAVDLSAEPYGAGILTVNLGGDGELVFDGYGVADTDGSVTVGLNGQYVTVTLDSASGQITVSDLHRIAVVLPPTDPGPIDIVPVIPGF
ncbi:MAG: Tfp pilus assembly protein FimT/FimU, partial [Phycisphaerae bacterium]